MSTEFIGFTLDTLGTILVSYAVIMVHYRFWKEHKIDEAVFTTMRRERMIAIFGVALIVVGYLLQIPSKL